MGILQRARPRRCQTLLPHERGADQGRRTLAEKGHVAALDQRITDHSCFAETDGAKADAVNLVATVVVRCMVGAMPCACPAAVPAMMDGWGGVIPLRCRAPRTCVGVTRATARPYRAMEPQGNRKGLPLPIPLRCRAYVCLPCNGLGTVVGQN